MAEQVYRPSEAVPVSGVYRVEHVGHRDAHEAILLEGELFPSCGVCENCVRFILQRSATKIRSDRGFSDGK